jgi:hypothetical protein
MVKVRAWVALLAGAAIVTGIATGCGVGGHRELQRMQLISDSPAGESRAAKARLIGRLASPPKVVIFGGSRAMRFDPAFIEQRTGLSAFNAAVMQARPEDTWAFLNLLHARFPTARFRFLWVVHADEFDPRPIDAAILQDPALARYFPAGLVKAQLPREFPLAQGRPGRVQIDVPVHGEIHYAADGYAMSGFFSNSTPPPNGNAGAVGANIEKELAIYSAGPASQFSRSVRYFAKDLRLMDSLGAARPVIVAAPFDRRIYAATLHRGWGARHRLLRALLARLRARYGFSSLDLSRSAAWGFTPNEFYDGIHLTPEGARRVVGLVLKHFPHAL